MRSKIVAVAAVVAWAGGAALGGCAGAVPTEPGPAGNARGGTDGGPAVGDGGTAPIDGAAPDLDGGPHARASDGDAGANDSEGGADAGSTDAASLGPVDLDASALYCVFPTVYSPSGTLGSVTADLRRIHDLGVDVIWLMPLTPVGQATGGHPAFGSPYSVKEYDAINPAYGTAQDLVALVRSAHSLGMHVIVDEVLNHTSWDNALITQHPEFYVHSDGNRQNPASIVQAFNYADVAQLDYKTAQSGLAKYMTDMLVRWVRAYDLDGFRFDSADNPYGAGRMIPASFWQALRPALEAAKPGLLMLGEEEDPALANAPFELDYGWHLQGFFGAGGLQQVAKGGDAALLKQAWTGEKTGYPAGMRHMNFVQNYDVDLDLTLYGGVPNAMAAAAFVFTMDGLPLLYNGEEVGNDVGGVNSQKPIHWNGPNAATFSPFYKSLLALRRANPALQQGNVDWLDSGGTAHVVSYARSDANTKFVVVINFSGASVTGTLAAPAGSVALAWTDVSPTGSPGGTAHPVPPSFSMKPYDFAVFRAR